MLTIGSQGKVNMDFIVHDCITFDWNIRKWSEIPPHKRNNLDFHFFPDLKLSLSLWNDKDKLNASINRSSCVASFLKFHCSLCFVNQNGEERMKNSNEVKFQTLNSMMLANWENDLIKKVLNEDNLIVRCVLSVEKEYAPVLVMVENVKTDELLNDVKERCTQTEISPFTNTNPVVLGNLFLETLSNDLSKLCVEKKVTDCVLKVADIQIPVHRAILSARSNVFAAMFSHNMMENNDGEVEIQDVDATIFGDVLHYIYTGKVHGLTENTAAEMYKVSDKYLLMELRKTCLEFLLHNLTKENICDAALLSHTHGQVTLEEEVVNFLDETLEEIIGSEKWRDLFEAKPAVANKFLSAAYLACKRREKQRLN